MYNTALGKDFWTNLRLDEIKINFIRKFKDDFFLHVLLLILFTVVYIGTGY